MSVPAWVPAVETKPAPMPLLLVQSFVNTYEAEVGTDLLADAAAAHAWLSDAGILPDLPLDEPGLALVRDIRESIRSLLVHNAGARRPQRRSCGRSTDSPAPRASVRAWPRAVWSASTR